MISGPTHAASGTAGRESATLGNFQARNRFAIHMKRVHVIELVAVAVLLACAPLQSAFAYVDPNSAGWLYQLLFPLLIAIGSAFAALRRVIAHAWSRFATRVVAVVRGERGERSEPREPTA